MVTDDPLLVEVYTQTGEQNQAPSTPNTAKDSLYDSLTKLREKYQSGFSPNRPDDVDEYSSAYPTSYTSGYSVEKKKETAAVDKSSKENTGNEISDQSARRREQSNSPERRTSWRDNVYKKEETPRKSWRDTLYGDSNKNSRTSRRDTVKRQSAYNTDNDGDVSSALEDDEPISPYAVRKRRQYISTPKSSAHRIDADSELSDVPVIKTKNEPGFFDTEFESITDVEDRPISERQLFKRSTSQDATTTAVPNSPSSPVNNDAMSLKDSLEKVRTWKQHLMDNPPEGFIPDESLNNLMSPQISIEEPSSDGSNDDANDFKKKLDSVGEIPANLSSSVKGNSRSSSGSSKKKSDNGSSKKQSSSESSIPFSRDVSPNALQRHRAQYGSSKSASGDSCQTNKDFRKSNLNRPATPNSHKNKDYRKSDLNKSGEMVTSKSPSFEKQASIGSGSSSDAFSRDLSPNSRGLTANAAKSKSLERNKKLSPSKSPIISRRSRRDAWENNKVASSSSGSGSGFSRELSPNDEEDENLGIPSNRTSYSKIPADRDTSEETFERKSPALRDKIPADRDTSEEGFMRRPIFKDRSSFNTTAATVNQATQRVNADEEESADDEEGNESSAAPASSSSSVSSVEEVIYKKSANDKDSTLTRREMHIRPKELSPETEGRSITIKQISKYEADKLRNGSNSSEDSAIGENKNSSEIAASSKASSEERDKKDTMSGITGTTEENVKPKRGGSESDSAKASSEESGAVRDIDPDEVFKTADTSGTQVCAPVIQNSDLVEAKASFLCKMLGAPMKFEKRDDDDFENEESQDKNENEEDKSVIQGKQSSSGKSLSTRDTSSSESEDASSSETESSSNTSESGKEISEKESDDENKLHVSKLDSAMTFKRKDSISSNEHEVDSYADSRISTVPTESSRTDSRMSITTSEASENLTRSSSATSEESESESESSDNEPGLEKSSSEEELDMTNKAMSRLDSAMKFQRKDSRSSQEPEIDSRTDSRISEISMVTSEVSQSKSRTSSNSDEEEPTEESDNEEFPKEMGLDKPMTFRKTRSSSEADSRPDSRTSGSSSESESEEESSTSASEDSYHTSPNLSPATSDEEPEERLPKLSMLDRARGLSESDIRSSAEPELKVQTESYDSPSKADELRSDSRLSSSETEQLPDEQQIVISTNEEDKEKTNISIIGKPMVFKRDSKSPSDPESDTHPEPGTSEELARPESRSSSSSKDYHSDENASVSAADDDEPSDRHGESIFSCPMSFKTKENSPEAGVDAAEPCISTQPSETLRSESRLSVETSDSSRPESQNSLQSSEQSRPESQLSESSYQSGTSRSQVSSSSEESTAEDDETSSEESDEVSESDQSEKSSELESEDENSPSDVESQSGNLTVTLPEDVILVKDEEPRRTGISFLERFDKALTPIVRIVPIDDEPEEEYKEQTPENQSHLQDSVSSSDEENNDNASHKKDFSFMDKVSGKPTPIASHIEIENEQKVEENSISSTPDDGVDKIEQCDPLSDNSSENANAANRDNLEETMAPKGRISLMDKLLGKEPTPQEPTIKEISVSAVSAGELVRADVSQPVVAIAGPKPDIISSAVPASSSDTDDNIDVPTKPRHSFLDKLMGRTPSIEIEKPDDVMTADVVKGDAEDDLSQVKLNEEKEESIQTEDPLPIESKTSESEEENENTTKKGGLSFMDRVSGKPITTKVEPSEEKSEVQESAEKVQVSQTYSKPPEKDSNDSASDSEESDSTTRKTGISFMDRVSGMPLAQPIVKEQCSEAIGTVHEINNTEMSENLVETSREANESTQSSEEDSSFKERKGYSFMDKLLGKPIEVVVVQPAPEQLKSVESIPNESPEADNEISDESSAVEESDDEATPKRKSFLNRLMGQPSVEQTDEIQSEPAVEDFRVPDSNKEITADSNEIEQQTQPRSRSESVASKASTQESVEESEDEATPKRKSFLNRLMGQTSIEQTDKAQSEPAVEDFRVPDTSDNERQTRSRSRSKSVASRASSQASDEWYEAQDEPVEIKVDETLEGMRDTEVLSDDDTEDLRSSSCLSEVELHITEDEDEKPKKLSLMDKLIGKTRPMKSPTPEKTTEETSQSISSSPEVIEEESEQNDSETTISESERTESPEEVPVVKKSFLSRMLGVGEPKDKKPESEVIKYEGETQDEEPAVISNITSDIVDKAEDSEDGTSPESDRTETPEDSPAVKTSFLSRMLGTGTSNEEQAKPHASEVQQIDSLKPKEEVEDSELSSSPCLADETEEDTPSTTESDRTPSPEEKPAVKKSFLSRMLGVGEVVGNTELGDATSKEKVEKEREEKDVSADVPVSEVTSLTKIDTSTGNDTSEVSVTPEPNESEQSESTDETPIVKKSFLSRMLGVGQEEVKKTEPEKSVMEKENSKEIKEIEEPVSKAQDVSGTDPTIEQDKTDTTSPAKASESDRSVTPDEVPVAKKSFLSRMLGAKEPQSSDYITKKDSKLTDSKVDEKEQAGPNEKEEKDTASWPPKPKSGTQDKLVLTRQPKKLDIPMSKFDKAADEQKNSDEKVKEKAGFASRVGSNSRPSSSASLSNDRTCKLPSTQSTTDKQTQSPRRISDKQNSVDSRPVSRGSEISDPASSVPSQSRPGSQASYLSQDGSSRPSSRTSGYTEEYSSRSSSRADDMFRPASQLSSKSEDDSRPSSVASTKSGFSSRPSSKAETATDSRTSSRLSSKDEKQEKKSQPYFVEKRKDSVDSKRRDSNTSSPFGRRASKDQGTWPPQKKEKTSFLDRALGGTSKSLAMNKFKEKEERLRQEKEELARIEAEKKARIEAEKRAKAKAEAERREAERKAKELEEKRKAEEAERERKRKIREERAIRDAEDAKALEKIQKKNFYERVYGKKFEPVPLKEPIVKELSSAEPQIIPPSTSGKPQTFEEKRREERRHMERERERKLREASNKARKYQRTKSKEEKSAGKQTSFFERNAKKDAKPEEKKEKSKTANEKSDLKEDGLSERTKRILNRAKELTKTPVPKIEQYKSPYASSVSDTKGKFLKTEEPEVESLESLKAKRKIKEDAKAKEAQAAAEAKAQKDAQEDAHEKRKGDRYTRPYKSRDEERHGKSSRSYSRTKSKEGVIENAKDEVKPNSISPYASRTEKKTSEPEVKRFSIIDAINERLDRLKSREDHYEKRLKAEMSNHEERQRYVPKPRATLTAYERRSRYGSTPQPAVEAPPTPKTPEVQPMFVPRPPQEKKVVPQEPPKPQSSFFDKKRAQRPQAPYLQTPKEEKPPTTPAVTESSKEDNTPAPQQTSYYDKLEKLRSNREKLEQFKEQELRRMYYGAPQFPVDQNKKQDAHNKQAPSSPGVHFTEGSPNQQSRNIARSPSPYDNVPASKQKGKHDKSRGKTMVPVEPISSSLPDLVPQQEQFDLEDRNRKGAFISKVTDIDSLLGFNSDDFSEDWTSDEEDLKESNRSSRNYDSSEGSYRDLGKDIILEPIEKADLDYISHCQNIDDLLGSYGAPQLHSKKSPAKARLMNRYQNVEDMLGMPPLQEEETGTVHGPVRSKRYTGGSRKTYDAMSKKRQNIMAMQSSKLPGSPTTPGMPSIAALCSLNPDAVEQTWLPYEKNKQLVPFPTDPEALQAVKTAIFIVKKKGKITTKELLDTCKKPKPPDLYYRDDDDPLFESYNTVDEMLELSGVNVEKVSKIFKIIKATIKK